MILIGVYCIEASGCFAKYLVGCDILTMAITLSEAFWLETLL